MGPSPELEAVSQPCEPCTSVKWNKMETEGRGQLPAILTAPGEAWEWELCSEFLLPSGSLAWSKSSLYEKLNGRIKNTSSCRPWGFTPVILAAKSLPLISITQFHPMCLAHHLNIFVPSKGTKLPTNRIPEWPSQCQGCKTWFPSLAGVTFIKARHTIQSGSLSLTSIIISYARPVQ
jgi:hypothetical protein